MHGPDPNAARPNEARQPLLHKNIIWNPNILVGAYTDYDDGGANAVVSGDIPPYAVADGNPCRVVRQRFSEKTTALLLRLQWCGWPPKTLFTHLEAPGCGDLSQLQTLENGGL